MHGRTTFMIAHRLSTLRSCDIQIRVERGRVLALALVGPLGEEAPQLVDGAPSAASVPATEGTAR
jgi:hypothetical protein